MAAIHLHARCGQGLFVSGGAVDGDSTTVEAVATAAVAAHHLRVTALESNRDHLTIQQRHQPTHRPGKAALTGAPAHEAAPLEAADPLGDTAAEQLRCRATPLEHGGEHKRSLRGFTNLESLSGDTAALGKAFSGGCGYAVFESLRGRRAFALFLEIRCGGLQVVHLQRDAAWRTGAANGTVAQPGFAQVTAHHLLELGQRETGKIGGQFLGPDLQQKGRHEVQATTAAHCIEGLRLSPRSVQL